MASVALSTPVKSHKGLFSARTAGGRMPLTPSPRQQASTTNVPINLNSSPFTPERQSSNDFRPSGRSTYGGNLMSHLARSTTKTSHRDSPKSNIARGVQTPRKALELGVSDFTLTGTGNNTKTPASKKTKPSKTTKTTLNYGGDRFIPNRGASSAINNAGSGKLDLPDRQRPKSSKVESSNVLSAAADEALAALESLNINDDDEPDNYSRPSPNTVAYQDSLANACGVSLNTRILEFKPAAPESSKPIDLRQQYNRPLKSTTTSSAQLRRRIATAPERVLDAPGLVDDYYLNLLDWSSGNQVAIGLERNVYVWSADEGSVSCLLETTPDTYVSSVKWSGDGAYVSVGLGTGEVQIWDVAEGQKIRSMFGHDTRVGVMGWNKHLLSTGARSGLVYNHDVRIAEHKVAELVSHTSEVCGLEWRSDGAQLATGGNDNLVSIWDARSLSVPKFTKTNHKAAVKALSWCPWNMNLLATGGGSYDRHIHFWNSTSGARVNSIDTGSQVTSLRWSPHHREIVSSSGFPDNSLSIWSYPTLVRTVEIPAHESRVLHSCLSPDGQMLATAAADESLKFWKIFEKKAGATASIGASGASSKASMAKQMTIR
ncbi:WD40-repeat-containing domain protein [Fusarium flagelliforme]|uniref:Cell division cycle 20, cofactor-apc complex n=1 Tax=Fusarium flagelliforme TaxID=2675880 RepID=A0A395MZB5_9HYPO|nr:WD40-repeat-containing domain protein [Fusarium flagelliforme]KAH7196762.1 WD40-repeat-containing domain protein [Fusarium flagelliforme]RFN53231.1 cell division cycle 20, cofactor-apc complex [Fusarium flagelliforme]